MKRTSIFQLLITVACMQAFLPANGGELTDLLTATLDHPGIEAREHDVEAASRALAAETARYLGSGQAMAESSRFEDKRIVGVYTPDASFSLPPVDRTVERYGVSWRLPVDVFGVISAARKRARSDLQAARLAELQQTLLKLHQVTTAYVRLQALERQQQGLIKRREALGKTMDRVSTEVELGKAAKVDLRLADSEIARVKADTVRLRGAIDQARAELEEASGHSALPSVSRIYVPRWQTAGVDQSLPVKLSGAQASAAQAHAEEVGKSLWPSLSVGGDYFEFDGGGASPDAWSVTLGISVPLDLTAHRRRSAAQSQARAAAAEQAAAKRETRRQLTALKASYESAIADAKALQAELAYRNEVVQLETEKHRLGAQTLENLLRHERDWLDTLFRLANAEAKATSAWSAAQVLLGTPVNEYIAAADAMNAGAENPNRQKQLN